MVPLQYWSKLTLEQLDFWLGVAEVDEAVAIQMRQSIAENLIKATVIVKADGVVTPAEKEMLDAIAAGLAAFKRREKRASDIVAAIERAIAALPKPA